MGNHFEIDENGFVKVWTDGACINNGNYGARAGIGVYFADNHYLNVSAPIPNRYRATNQVAEILAVKKAASQAISAGVRNLRIITDSKFVINCIKKWIPKWKENGWRKVDGYDVVNKTELIEMDDTLKCLNHFTLEHVPAHAKIYENEMADQFAKNGANSNYYSDSDSDY